MKKKRSLLGNIIRYLGAVITLLIFSVLAIHFWGKTTSLPCANSISCINNLNVDVENDSVGIINDQKIIPPKIVLSVKDMKPTVLGTETGVGEKHIYVDLTKQTLYAYQGDTLFMQTLISSGKWFDTPPGDFRIWIKLRATRMSGGSGADYYNLPNVPYVMFFSGGDISAARGFSLHGAYWHNNFGHPMSHGCVNMRISDAEKLYNWVNPITNGYTTRATTEDQGTLVTIYGKAP
ncbi:L,D-transpeptidase [Candidatus Woesebacteria bacterium]|nr:L,D-transpeptidase [Candidatus Woesebacteria bacterium]